MMTGRGKTRGCYYCGKPATSREHAPPKALFRGFDCDSITVPSCGAHNNKKDFRDQAIVIGLAVGVKEAGARSSLPDRVRSCVEGLLEEAHRVKRAVTLLPIGHGGGLPSFRLPYIEPHVRLREWARQLTAALVFDATQQFDSHLDWARAYVDSPHWVDASGNAIPKLQDLAHLLKQKRTEYAGLQDLPWTMGWSARPRPYPAEIYRFEFLCGEGAVVFRHTFFSSYVWYVGFDSPETTATRLLQKATGLAGPGSRS